MQYQPFNSISAVFKTLLKMYAIKRCAFCVIPLNDPLGTRKGVAYGWSLLIWGVNVHISVSYNHPYLL